MTHEIKKGKKSVVRNATVVAFFTAISRVFGLLRDLVTFHYFGVSMLTDAFFIAFTIPNMLRRFVAEGALTVAFIPIYSEVKKQKGKEEAIKFFKAILGLLLIVVILLTVVGVFFAKYWVIALASGFSFSTEKFELTVLLTRYLFPYIIFISLVALSMGVLNANKHFAIPAASPVLLNISMIFMVIVFHSFFENPIFALVYGVLLGGMLQLLLQVPILLKKNLLAYHL